LAQAKPAPEFLKLWDFNKPAETETKFRELLPKVKAAGNLDEELQLLTQIARTQALQRKFDEAFATLDGVEKRLTPKTPLASIRVPLERGRVYRSSKQPEVAMPCFLLAFETAKNEGEEALAIDALHMVALVEPSKDKQIEWTLQAMDRAEKAKAAEARDWTGSLSNNLGWTYHDMGRFEDAQKMFEKALAFREGKKDAVRIREAKWAVARGLRSLKKYPEAMKIQRALEAEFEKIGEKDGYVFEEIAELSLLTDKSADAKKYFARAYEELSKDEGLKANEPDRLARLKKLGRN